MSDSTTPITFLGAVGDRYGAVDEQLDTYDFSVSSNKVGKVKKWEMVGMEKTRKQQSQHSRLVTIVLKDAGITVAEAAEGEIKAAAMNRVSELDISGNKAVTMADVDIIVKSLPAVTLVQLNRIPVLAHAPTLTFAWPLLRQLVLNGTSLDSLEPLRGLNMPVLEEIHVDSNNLSKLLTGTIPTAGAAVFVEPFAGLPNVTTVSIAQNAFVNWHTTIESSGGVMEGIPLGFDYLPLAFPKLVSLSVCGCEQLVDIDESLLVTDQQQEGDLLQFRPLRQLLAQLTTLDVSDCPRIVNPEQTLTILRRHCPLDEDNPSTTMAPLTILRMSYTHSYLTRRSQYPSEAVARYVTIATIPSLATLNRAAVRPKERADAEMYYMQRAASSFPKAASGELTAEGAAEMSAQFPEYARLATKYPLITAQLININGLSGSDGGDGNSTSLLLLSVKLVCDGHAMVEKRVPAMLSVGKLRQLIANTYPHVPLESQEITFWNSNGGDGVAAPVPLVEKQSSLETGAVNSSAQHALDDRSLAFFGVANGATIKLVEDK